MPAGQSVSSECAVVLDNISDMFFGEKWSSSTDYEEEWSSGIDYDDTGLCFLEVSFAMCTNCISVA